MAGPASGERRAQSLKVAEHVERGVEAYATGDVAGAVRELEAALQLQPEHVRVQLYLGWLRGLAAGKVRPYGHAEAVDEDTLAAVSDALAGDDLFGETPVPGAPPADEDQTREKRVAAAGGESPWDPVPLTPGHAQAPREISLQELESIAPPAAARERRDTPMMGSVPKTSAPAPQRSPSASTNASTRKSSQTLLGVAPVDASLLTPGSLYDENTRAVTREWRSTPTGTNLPPLDVPELTDEQIQELLALDNAPSLEVGGAPRLPTMDLPVGPDVLGSIEPAVPHPPTIEMEAEPTPNPHPNPLIKKRDATTPDAEFGPTFGGNDFDQGSYDLTPTRERKDLLKQLAAYPAAAAEEDPDLLSLEITVGEQAADSPEEGSYPTNPFIQQRLAEYASYTSPPKEEELPLPPAAPPSDTSPTTALEGMPSIQDPLDRGDVDEALRAAEQFVEEQGGLNTDACLEQRWLLERVYEATVGPLGAVPSHGTPTPDLDPRSAFLLSRIDGMSSAEDLLEISGMPRLEALRCLALLIRRGAVAMR